MWDFIDAPGSLRRSVAAAWRHLTDRLVPGARWQVRRWDGGPLRNSPARVLAFYLPQAGPLSSRARRREAALARAYGIEGFCLRLHWRRGRARFERRLTAYLADRTLDLPFCLCWASDGSSPDQERDVIVQLARHIRDSRYLRVRGKPLIILERGPSPALRDTVSCWRAACQENGVGEPLVALRESSAIVSPDVRNLDAVIAESDEVPPWKMSDFTGLQWQALSAGPSPAAYSRRLESAVAASVSRIADRDARLVFVHAWNDRAGSARLARGRDHGYLEATRMALVRAAARAAAPAAATADAPLAVVVHAFYPDIFRQWASDFDALGLDFKLFVTAPASVIGEIRTILAARNYAYEIIDVENRGRDVAPFLQVLRRAAAEGFPLILKLHTKRSAHFDGGDRWREEMYSALAPAAQLHGLIARLGRHPEIGIIGPPARVVPMRTYWAPNEARVRWLAGRLGFETVDLDNDTFVAGTMFLARTAALEPLMNLAITLDDFEPERGQYDGTLAHALERAIAYSARAAGLSVVGADESDASAGSAA